jgi:aryl-alcohol dehydrogenase-like predicted oxidoreductase
MEHGSALDPHFAIGGDLRVGRLGFGAMRLCGSGVWGEPADPAAARALLREAVEQGVTVIDTADAYGPEVNERQIADALHPYPTGVHVATKGGYTRPAAGRWVPDGRPEHLIEACEASLRRLKLDAIDLYQLHTPDPKVPFEESVGALKRLRDEGKIRHAGLSNVDVAQLRAAQAILPIASVQNAYNVGDRESEDVVRACAREAIAFLAYYPIDAGDLAKAGGELADIAGSHGATTVQIALAWLLQHAPNVIPIPGTSSPAHLRENLGAARIVLSDAEVERLDASAA